MKDTETPDISKKETKTVRLDNVQFAIIIFSIYATGAMVYFKFTFALIVMVSFHTILTTSLIISKWTKNSK